MYSTSFEAWTLPKANVSGVPLEGEKLVAKCLGVKGGEDRVTSEDGVKRPEPFKLMLAAWERRGERDPHYVCI